METEHIKSENLTTNVWSGGTTTQLYIYPPNADYRSRNFLFRVSTATVEEDESVFTKLHGITRHLILLDGNLKVQHNQLPAKTMERFDIITFAGDWDTKSYGNGIDFNLMTQQGIDGFVNVYKLNKHNSASMQENLIDCEMTVFYIYSGFCNVETNNMHLFLNTKDVFVFKNIEQNTTVKINTEEQLVIAVAKIKLK